MASEQRRLRRRKQLRLRKARKKTYQALRKVERKYGGVDFDVDDLTSVEFDVLKKDLAAVGLDVDQIVSEIVRDHDLRAIEEPPDDI